ncbi:hypothetical protein CLV43_114311 [Umezawaea tangerina]|uniref:Uncharacterized protein n=1 Tax=Umezawaea tangerina TaxID=84725 RepID=A0A2T0SPV4_9PSEU|nr:hypothetical protein CLV43_114311 [Umezawaea tangerina]
MKPQSQIQYWNPLGRPLSWEQHKPRTSPTSPGTGGPTGPKPPTKPPAR